MLYFAYGSNLSHQQMPRRCPGYKFVGRGVLHDYILIFDGYSTNWQGAVANVIPKPKSRVMGGLYLLTPEQLNKLDQYEELGIKYNRQILIVEASNKKMVNACVYLRPPLTIGRPSEDYINTIKEGYRNCGIEDTY